MTANSCRRWRPAFWKSGMARSLISGAATRNTWQARGLRRPALFRRQCAIEQRIEQITQPARFSFTLCSQHGFEILLAKFPEILDGSCPLDSRLERIAAQSDGGLNSVGIKGVE